MRTKVPSFPIRLFTALTLAVITLSGCGQTPLTTQSPTSTAKPLSTLVVNPNAPPAVCKFSNLTAQLMPEDGPNVYIFFVDVENTGGQPGNFSITYRVDNGTVENEKFLKVDPGQKKQLRLIGPELEIISMGQDYDKGATEVRQHTLSCGDLTLPITLAERPALYMDANSTAIDFSGGNIILSGEVKNINGNITVNGEVKNISGNLTFIENVKNINGNITVNGVVINSSGNITASGNIVIVSGEVKNSSENLTVSGNIIIVSGEVQNTSNKTLENVVAAVDIRASTSQQMLILVNHAEAPVENQSIMPGQTTPFKVVMPDNIPINLMYYDYRVTFKDAAGAFIRTIDNSNSTQ